MDEFYRQKLERFVPGLILLYMFGYIVGIVAFLQFQQQWGFSLLWFISTSSVIVFPLSMYYIYDIGYKKTAFIPAVPLILFVLAFLWMTRDYSPDGSMGTGIMLLIAMAVIPVLAYLVYSIVVIYEFLSS